MKIFYLMLAGALGTLARYGLTILIQNWISRGDDSASGVLQAAAFQPATFPLGTLIVNVLGSFLLAVVVTLALEKSVSPDARLVLGSGFLGAFTTFSTFELEAAQLWSDRAWPAASLYIAGNLLGGLLAILLGRALVLRVVNGAF